MNVKEFPLVSAIITTHNRKSLVEKAIDSVLKQTYPNMELIIVDDASDDGTKERLEERSQKDHFRYIYIPKEESKGGNYARNLGIKKAAGAYIAFLDDDDEWMPTKTTRQMEFLASHPDYGVVSCLRIKEYDFERRELQSEQCIIEGDVSKRIFTIIPYVTSTILLRKDILDKCGVFDENLKYWQEYELSIRFSQITNVGVIHEHLCLYRILNNDKVRLTNKLEGWEDAVRYINKKHENLISKLPSTMYEQRQLMIAEDGVARAIKTNEGKSYRKFRWIIFKYNPTIRNLAHFITGLNGSNMYKKIKSGFQKA